MMKQCCANCIYAYWDGLTWLRTLSSGWPTRPLCANHPDTPGQLRQVSSAGVCRNYRPKPAATQGDIKRLPLGESQYALVDAADYEWLSRHNWHLQNGYAVRWEKHNKRVYMHREIMQPPEGMIVDHINLNKLDNCRANLRVCTRQENMRNMGKCGGSSSRFKGVGYRKDSHKWYATIRWEGKPIWLGYFTDEIEAARAYDRKAVELFGEFAHLDFPEEWPAERRQKVYADAQPLRKAVKAKAAQAKRRKGKGKKAKRKSKGGAARRERRHTVRDAKRATKRSSWSAHRTSRP